MRLFRKCAQEDVNYEHRKPNFVNLVDNYQFALPKPLDQPVFSHRSTTAQIKNDPNAKNPFKSNKTRQSSNDIGQNQNTLRSSSVAFVKRQRTNFQNVLEKFIVRKSKRNQFLNVLKIIIKFIYHVILNSIVSILFDPKTIPFVDSHFVVNRRRARSSSEQHQSCSRTINKPIANSVINDFLINGFNNRQNYYKSTENVIEYRTKINRTNSRRSRSNSSDCTRMCYNRKMIECKNQNVKNYLVLKSINKSHVNKFSITTTFSLLSSAAPTTTKPVIQAIWQGQKDTVLRVLRDAINTIVDFYSSFNLCDKLIIFLKFYNDPIRLSEFPRRIWRILAEELINCGIAQQPQQNLKRVFAKWNQSKIDKISLNSLKSKRNGIFDRHRFHIEQLLLKGYRKIAMAAIRTTSRVVSFNKPVSDYCRCALSVLYSVKCISMRMQQLYHQKWYYQCCKRLLQGLLQVRTSHTQKHNGRRPICKSNRFEFHRIFGIPLRTLRNAFLIAFITSVPHISASFHHNIKYSVNVVKTKYGPLRGVVIRSNPTVEAFLGVPYASPPVGSLRYMPPVTPSTWRNTRLADRFSPVCPQIAPVAPSGPEALLEVPRGRLAQLRRLLPLLTNQSEDCLYLNLYVPRTIYPTPPSGTGSFGGDVGATGPGLGASDSSSSSGNPDGTSHHNIPNDAPEDKPVPAILYIHGESYEWNSGNPYDGSVLAAHGNVIVVTINFRLGVLGFLKTGGKGSAQGNFGLMDLVAGLHWLRENLPAFGGDPNKVTVMGHGTGAALANILIVSPVASDLVHRAILLSGSALSPWAIQNDPLFVKRRVAEQTGCHGDMLVDDLAPCLRSKAVSELLSIKIDSPRFLPGFAPFIDGTVIVHPSGGAAGPLTLPAGSAIASTSGIELADFPNRELIFGLTTIESYLDLSAQDLEFGFNETRRDRILRTYVRNVYHYHLNEIYAALKNEYTDWEKPVRNSMGSRDASLEFLSDGHTAAPLIRLGYLHSLRGGRSYFLHFRHQSGERDFPQRGGSVRGEDVPFCLGLPISPLFPYNYTKQDIKISRVLVRYLTNFALTGNPNESPTASVDISHIVHSSKTGTAGLVSSSLTLASALPASSLPPSMSLVASGSSVSSSSTPSFSTSSFSGQHQSQPSSLSTSFSSISTSSITTSLGSSSSAAALAAAVSATPIFDHQRNTSSSSTSSTSSSSSSSSASSSISRIVGETKTSSIFVAPPMHTAIKSKRHAVAAHRRKRKTTKRMSSLSPNLHQKRTINGSPTKKLNYRKKFLAGSSVNEKFGTASAAGSSLPSSSMSFQGDEQSSNRRLKETIRSRRLDEDSMENDEEDDHDDDEEEDDETEDDDSNENRRNNIDNNNNNNDDDDDEDQKNGGNKSNIETDDDDNNSRNRDTDENYNNGGEKFDRFDNFNILPRLPYWDTYDAINQLYLELGNKMEVKNHYRGHKLSMWLSLIPQLHSPGDLSELPMRHHHFMEDSAQYYDGIIRPQIMQRPSFPKAPVQQPSAGGHRIPTAVPTISTALNAARHPSATGTTTTPTVNPKTDHPGFNVGIPATTECPPNTTIVPTIAATRPQNHQQNIGSIGSGGSSSGIMTSPKNNEAGTIAGSNKQDNSNNLLRRLAGSQFQSYTTALTVTIAVGCFLLLLNILIFAGIYYQREKRATDAKKKQLLREAENLCASTTNLEKIAAEGGFSGSCSGGMAVGSKNSRKSSLQSVTTNFGEYSCYDEKIQCKEKHALADICSVELPLKEFKYSNSSPAPSHTGSLSRQHQQQSNSTSGNILTFPPSYQHAPQSTQQHRMHHHYAEQQQGCSDNDLVTYQQFQKPQHFHHHQQQQQQQRSATGSSGCSGSGSGSASVGTSTEQCNQSTQSEQPTVQDVATSIDEKSVAATTSLGGYAASGGDSSSCGGSSSTGVASTSRASGCGGDGNMISPDIPEPPPPPKSTAPYQGGILRQPGPPTAPNSNKKRVQIQEISV